ncbi:RagB/SusD family nutrient uptake outer membrane protein [Paraflavitalea speifideaquila]|uniref:RagB/SusD family nutrient uptake outer membrane protein n=1 Tax=Paraflavitalea speifideaquila TaxID=3076558 RepID=UPI0028E6C381|nr:RagB/SusD family nutrient uptake outer membrane protein [Paraflavitalea speifideiaquila]
MKKTTLIIATLLILSGGMLFLSSCRKDLLKQDPTTEMLGAEFWQTDGDAMTALMGAYAATRPCFDRDYYFDGQGDYVRARGTSTISGNLRLGDAYNGGNYGPTGYAGAFDKMYRYLYGAVNRANYVIDNVNTMIASKIGNRETLDLIIAEARVLRGLAYFKLMSMWGDVPYFTKTVSTVATEANAEMLRMTRLPIGQVKDSILNDLNLAIDKLPAKAAALGRITKPATVALRGKVQLYWGSWKKNGWPELEGFTQDLAAATAAFTAAALDFKSVINDYGLSLYLSGDPGIISGLGRADSLPNYYHLFTPKANGNSEMLLVFTHGGNSTNQGKN